MKHAICLKYANGIKYMLFKIESNYKATNTKKQLMTNFLNPEFPLKKVVKYYLKTKNLGPLYTLQN